MGKVDMYDYIKVLSICITNENKWKVKMKKYRKNNIGHNHIWGAPMNYNIHMKYIYIFQVSVLTEDHISYETYPLESGQRMWAYSSESNEKMLTPLNQMQIHPLSFYWASVPSPGPVTNASDKVLALELALYTKGEIRMNK